MSTRAERELAIAREAFRRGSLGSVDNANEDGESDLGATLSNIIADVDRTHPTAVPATTSEREREIRASIARGDTWDRVVGELLVMLDAERASRPVPSEPHAGPLRRLAEQFEKERDLESARADTAERERDEWQRKAEQSTCDLAESSASGRRLIAILWPEDPDMPATMLEIEARAAEVVRERDAAITARDEAREFARVRDEVLVNTRAELDAATTAQHAAEGRTAALVEPLTELLALESGAPRGFDYEHQRIAAIKAQKTVLGLVLSDLDATRRKS
jgi:hypothetical protein